jgi:SHS2 domain-containing protein
MKHYEFIDHTADIGIRVSGENLAALFANAGYALFELLVDTHTLIPRQHRQLQCTACDLEELMFSWIHELLAGFIHDSWTCTCFDVSIRKKWSLCSTLKGFQGTIPVHLLRYDIKAITYHDLYVRREDGGWVSQLIFDV